MTNYRTHPEYRALLAAVCASPKDDLPRLVLADWYEENGQCELAEFVNVQCELEKPCTACGGEGRYDDDRGGMMQCRGCFGDKTMRRYYGNDALRRRERELFISHFREWSDGMPGGAVNIVDMGAHGPNCCGNQTAHWAFRRGFISEVRCTLADWCGMCGHSEHGERCSYGIIPLGDASFRCPACHGTGRTTAIGPRLVREHPVERVVLVDREPMSVSGASYCWQNKDHPNQDYHDDLECYMLPGAVIDLIPVGWSDNVCLRWFNTHNAADAALSAALIAWAKSQGVGDE